MWRDLRGHEADDYDLSEPEVFEFEPYPDYVLDMPLSVVDFFMLVTGE